jgi:hypothetical protein
MEVGLRKTHAATTLTLTQAGLLMEVIVPAGVYTSADMSFDDFIASGIDFAAGRHVRGGGW